MLRRLHTPRVFAGEVPLDPAQIRHARDVLRLGDGALVEVFDDQGTTATGVLRISGARTAVQVDRIEQAIAAAGARIIVAAAVPKGERADWMVEKLSELGVWAFVPLAAQRSVVLPQRKGKHERWMRLAAESAKQSRRAGVMRIEELTPLDEVLDRHPDAIALSTAPQTPSLIDILQTPRNASEPLLLIGPEGGWTDAEINGFQQKRVRQAHLTDTVLRVETAAVAAAAIAAAMLAR